MMSIYERMLEDPNTRRELCVESTITNITELLSKQLQEHELTQAEFAEKLGVTAGRVSQILDGNSNLTLRTVASALAVFDCVLDVACRRIDSTESRCVWFPVNRTKPLQNGCPHNIEPDTTQATWTPAAYLKAI